MGGFIIWIFLLSYPLSKYTTEKCVTILLLIFIFLVILEIFRVELSHWLLVLNIILYLSCYYCSRIIFEDEIFYKIFPFVILFIIALYGFLCILSITSPSIFCGYNYYYQGYDRLSIVFDNPNHLGNLLGFGIIYIFSFICSSNKYHIFNKILLWLVLTIITWGLFSTFSRGAWISCAIGLLVYYLWNIKTKYINTYALIYLLIIIILSFNYNMIIYNRVRQTSPSADRSVGHRLEVWKGTFRIIEQHSIRGIGVGNFGKVYNENFKPQYLQNEMYASAMNNYLTVMAELGVPALIVYNDLRCNFTFTLRIYNIYIRKIVFQCNHMVSIGLFACQKYISQ